MDLKIYPNPTDNILRISGYKKSRATVTVINSLGAIVMTKEIENNFCELELVHLNSGLYNILISNSEESFLENVFLNKDN